LRALLEIDGKKIVALSTLRQLGVIFVALGVGNSLICFFHLIIHALAKANLFLVVGRFIHSRFREQDFRYIHSGANSRMLYLCIFISILSLRGIVLRAGFFRKEIILFSHYSVFNRMFR
jgi:NADH:ubiquinone oxidoreductase subunit 5 (subunit L)/multisubunit Na+/H+ antiporter MnhA subunit